jgi:hypothetical protein
VCAYSPALAQSAAVADTVPSYPGFDIGAYPGDAAMRAWARPSSPYYWTGYYLPSPCHRNASWSHKRSAIAAMGWGAAAIYVGQQDFSQMVHAAPRADQTVAPTGPCSATLLTAAQGAIDASDAATKMRAEGFPARRAVFLNVEQVQTVTPALLAYYQAWVAGMLRDGRYRPGTYVAKANAPTLYAAALEAYRSVPASGSPIFWVASNASFTTNAAPAAVGLDYAVVWQGMFDVTQTWNGVTLKVDVDVATTKSPSAP